MEGARICPECGTANEKGRDICWQCFQSLGHLTTSATRTFASSRPSSLPPLEPVKKFSPDQIDYAGFWIRTWAAIIDGVFMSFVITPILFLLFGKEMTSSEALLRGSVTLWVTWALPMAVIIVFWMVTGATPGKSAMGLRIADADTFGRPTFLSLLLRALGYSLSSAFFGLGYFWIGFDAKKQGWHDKIANTIVARRTSLPLIPQPATSSKSGFGTVAGAILTLIVIGAGIFGFSSLSAGIEKLRTQAEQTKIEAAVFAESHTSRDCMMEALGRDGSCKDIGCHINTKVFLEQSLKTAVREPTLCIGIPKSTDVLNSKLWKSKQCEQKGRNDTNCIALYEILQAVCDNPS